MICPICVSAVRLSGAAIYLLSQSGPAANYTRGKKKKNENKRLRLCVGISHETNKEKKNDKKACSRIRVREKPEGC